MTDEEKSEETISPRRLRPKPIYLKTSFSSLNSPVTPMAEKDSDDEKKYPYNTVASPMVLSSPEPIEEKKEIIIMVPIDPFQV